MNAVSQISSEMSAALALDLAADIWPEAEVFSNHGLDPTYGAALLCQDWFRKMVDEARREWGSISNAKQRIRLKSQLALEHSIEEIYKVVTDKKIPAAARVAAFKELKDLSGVTQGEQAAGDGRNSPTVNIFLNGSAEPAISISSSSRKNVENEENDVVDVTPSNQLGFDVGLAPL